MKLLRAWFGTGSRWLFSTLLTTRASQCVHTTPSRVSHRARRLIELWRHFSRPAIFRPREQTTRVVRRGSPSLETLLVARSRCEGSDRRGAVTEVGGLLLFCQRWSSTFLTNFKPCQTDIASESVVNLEENRCAISLCTVTTVRDDDHGLMNTVSIASSQ